MREPRLLYTPEEDSIILSVVKEIQEENLPLNAAYMKLADQLNRPIKSVTIRHRRLAKALAKGEGVNKRRGRHSKTLSESEHLVLKLKGLKRDKDRSVEKIDHFKELYEGLKEENEKLRKNYRALEIEHANLIKTVKEALGEDDEDEDDDGELDDEMHSVRMIS